MLELDAPPWLGHGSLQKVLSCKGASFCILKVKQSILAANGWRETTGILTLALCVAVAGSGKLNQAFGALAKRSMPRAWD